MGPDVTIPMDAAFNQVVSVIPMAGLNELPDDDEASSSDEEEGDDDETEQERKLAALLLEEKCMDSLKQHYERAIEKLETEASVRFRRPRPAPRAPHPATCLKKPTHRTPHPLPATCFYKAPHPHPAALGPARGRE